MHKITEQSPIHRACDISHALSANSLRPKTRARLLLLLLAACALAGSTSFAQTDTTGTGTPPADPATTPPTPTIAFTQVQTLVMLNVQSAVAESTFQWRHNGQIMYGETNLMLVIPEIRPDLTGIYSVDITEPGAAAATTRVLSAIVGFSPNGKLAGTAREVQGDIAHANGNIYDQVLLTGPAATITADPNQITRLSYIDLNDDIVQVEFSGAGSLSIALDSYSPAAAPTKYAQPGVEYVKGHARIVVANANETTNVAIFSVGRATAVNQSLFRSDVQYDGVADIASLSIQSSNGNFGGVYTGNASYFAAKGITGVYAPGVHFTAPVNVGEITASDSAAPVLQLGSSTAVHITGGDLFQANNAPVEVSGITHLDLTAGATSQGTPLPAQTIKGRLMENGVDVTTIATTQ